MSQIKPTIVYDPQLEVIFIDYSGITLTKAMLEQVLEEVKKITNTLPKKVFVASCLQDTKFDLDLDEDFGQLTAELLRCVRGVIRYGVTDAFTNIKIRTSTVKKRLQGTQSHIYPTREAALEAIYKLRFNLPE